MKKIMQCSFLFAALIAHSVLSYAGEHVLHVSKHVVVNAAADDVWALVGDYNSLNQWHPAVKKSELRGDGYSHGDVRVLTLTDGAAIYDELTVYNAASKSYTYRLIKSPLPLYGYLGSMIVKDNGDKTSTVTWESRFYADGVSDDEAVALITGVYDGGLQSLKARFNQ
jgi:mxaD protein